MENWRRYIPDNKAWIDLEIMKVCWHKTEYHIRINEEDMLEVLCREGCSTEYWDLAREEIQILYAEKMADKILLGEE